MMARRVMGWPGKSQGKGSGHCLHLFLGASEYQFGPVVCFFQLSILSTQSLAIFSLLSEILLTYLVSRFQINFGLLFLCTNLYTSVDCTSLPTSGPHPLAQWGTLDVATAILSPNTANCPRLLCDENQGLAQSPLSLLSLSHRCFCFS